MKACSSFRSRKAARTAWSTALAGLPGFSADSPAIPDSPTKPGRYLVLTNSKGQYVIHEIDPSVTYIIGRAGDRFSLPPAPTPGTTSDSLKSQWGWNNANSPLNQSAHR